MGWAEGGWNCFELFGTRINSVGVKSHPNAVCPSISVLKPSGSATLFEIFFLPFAGVSAGKVSDFRSNREVLGYDKHEFGVTFFKFC